MTASISRYLTDFSAPKVNLSLMPPKYFSDPDDGETSPGLFAMHNQPLAAEPLIDIEAERAEAFDEGRQAAEAELSVIHADATADLMARHLAELDAMRSRCENEIAAMIAERFTELGTQVATMLSDQAARVLAPVMDETLTNKSVGDLAQMIKQFLGSDESCKIVVHGPASLFAALKAHFSDETLVFRHVESADTDLTVEIGNAILVTRMAAWADTVRKVLA